MSKPQKSIHVRLDFFLTTLMSLMIISILMTVINNSNGQMGVHQWFAGASSGLGFSAIIGIFSFAVARNS